MLVFIATWTNHLANFGWIVYLENGNGFDGVATDIVGVSPGCVRRVYIHD
jgi:hypothetical protein